jgi:hypothetical protein
MDCIHTEIKNGHFVSTIIRKTKMNEEDFGLFLSDVLETYLDLDDDNPSPIDNISTFNHAGILTMNEGLVIRLTSGEEFQLTIVRSK